MAGPKQDHSYVRCHSCGRKIAIASVPAHLERASNVKVHLQIRCKHPDCGHYDVYPLEEVKGLQRRTVH